MKWWLLRTAALCGEPQHKVISAPKSQNRLLITRRTLIKRTSHSMVPGGLSADVTAFSASSGKLASEVHDTRRGSFLGDRGSAWSRSERERPPSQRAARSERLHARSDSGESRDGLTPVGEDLVPSKLTSEPSEEPSEEPRRRVTFDEATTEVGRRLASTASMPLLAMGIDELAPVPSGDADSEGATETADVDDQTTRYMHASLEERMRVAAHSALTMTLSGGATRGDDGRLLQQRMGGQLERLLVQAIQQPQCGASSSPAPSTPPPPTSLHTSLPLLCFEAAVPSCAAAARVNVWRDDGDGGGAAASACVVELRVAVAGGSCVLRRRLELSQTSLETLQGETSPALEHDDAVQASAEAAALAYISQGAAQPPLSIDEMKSGRERGSPTLLHVV